MTDQEFNVESEFFICLKNLIYARRYRIRKECEKLTLDQSDLKPENFCVRG
jgi:hypothetical protein